MKKEKYYFFMLALCCLGSASCLLLPLFAKELSGLFKAAALVLNIFYILGAAYYRKKYTDYSRRKREYEAAKRKRKGYYPENSYYPGIRRSV